MVFSKDINLYWHIGLGILLGVLSVLTLMELNNKKSIFLKPYAYASAVVAWLVMLPSAVTYLVFYPATKSLVKAGSWPWAHSIIMETKEHWGLLIPLIATVGAILVYRGKTKESKKWWLLLLFITIAMAIMGRLIKMGALK